MSEKTVLSVEAQAELDARAQTNRMIALDWSEPSTWVIYGFGMLGLILMKSFLRFKIHLFSHSGESIASPGLKKMINRFY